MRQQNGTPAAPPAADSMTRRWRSTWPRAEAGTAAAARGVPGPLPRTGRGPRRLPGRPATSSAGPPRGRARRRRRRGGAAAGAAPGQLGDFRLIREVGRGGMGVVYEAEQISLGRRVALKVLPFAATMDPRQLQRFQNEARAAAVADHTHIVPVHAVGCERGVHFYAMQFIEGQTLAALIADLRRAGGRPVPTEEQPTTAQRPGVGGTAADTAAAGGGLDGAAAAGPGLLPARGRAGHPGGRGAGPRPRAGHRPSRRQAGQPAGGRRAAACG